MNDLPSRATFPPSRTLPRLYASSLLLGAFLLSGCGGPSTTGQVEVSEEAKAQIQSRRDTYSKRAKTSPAASKGKSSKSRR